MYSQKTFLSLFSYRNSYVALACIHRLDFMDLLFVVKCSSMVKARVVVFLAKLHRAWAGTRDIVRRNKIHAAEIGAQCFVTFSEIMADGRATVSYCEVESVQYRSHL